MHELGLKVFLTGIIFCMSFAVTAALTVGKDKLQQLARIGVAVSAIAIVAGCMLGIWG